jgi:UDP-glucuronate decarboxylase
MKTVVEAFTTVVERGAVDGPINVGSGTATTLRELALRVLKLTGSTSQLEVLPPRGPEVTRYVADTARMRECLGIEPPADPLASVAEWWEAS